MENLAQFAEKYQLALQTAMSEKPDGGLCGLELEWNLLDGKFRPLLTVGSGSNKKSFVDYLRSSCLPAWASQYSQLEVFHWMIEWATRPYYSPRSAVYEARLMEALMVNALWKAGDDFQERLYIWPGNLPILPVVDHSSIPDSWHLAKRLYLQRCVDLYGEGLATAGTHSNLSLPDPLFAWDFMHLPESERVSAGGARVHLDEYKSQFYITATRLMRAFASLFIACSAATPFQARKVDGQSMVVLTPYDSVRNLTFPNPAEIDLPDLYRSYGDYLRISNDLVERGVRFGNNNWTPTRARSFAEPVERLIEVTSGQLEALYARGLYVMGQDNQADQVARRIEMQNLMARIHLPMARVEVRTDDGGHALDLDVANLTLKHLLMIRFYADKDFARSFRYDREDILRARRNEELAAKFGLNAEIEHPLTGKPVGMRPFLAWLLGELKPLAAALELWEDIVPLTAMAAGEPNEAEMVREHVLKMLGLEQAGEVEVPGDALKELAEERERQVALEVEAIAASQAGLPPDRERLIDLIQHARDHAHHYPQAPIRFRPHSQARLDIHYPDKTSEILALAQQLIRIPSVTASPDERLEDVHRAATLIFDYVRDYGLGVRFYDQNKYPALIIGLPNRMHAPVMLCGHFDVVEPEPDDRQFEPRIEGDYLWGRGAADMKTVVATYLVWLKDQLHRGAPYPAINLLLVGNEENGEIEPMGTPHLLKVLSEESGYAPSLLIAGERTGEKGSETWGEICIQNRGVMRLEISVRGERAHSGVAAAAAGGAVARAQPSTDLTERLLVARAGITGIMGRYLTLSSPDGWQSQVKFPYIQIGKPGVFNITPDRGVLGVEVRPIPQDDLAGMLEEIQQYCVSLGLELNNLVMEPGIACDASDPYLAALVAALEQASGQAAVLGRKLPGTSARFASGGRGVVWGQSGIGPHTRNEAHFIPSILPYYRALDAYADRLRR